MPSPHSAFDEHKEELDHYEQMFGRERGRLEGGADWGSAAAAAEIGRLVG